jgi:hypothetical protein
MSSPTRFETGSPGIILGRRKTINKIQKKERRYLSNFRDKKIPAGWIFTIKKRPGWVRQRILHR